MRAEVFPIDPQWLDQKSRPEVAPIDTYPGLQSLDFKLPPHLEASAPPESRGLRRDEVRLMVSNIQENRVRYTRFTHLPEALTPGDLLVINTSGTLNAALPVRRADGMPLELHLSTHLPGDLWVIELRLPSAQGTRPFYTAEAGERLKLPEGGEALLLTPYRADQRGGSAADMRRRLWLATLDLPDELLPYLRRCGFPIHYPYVPKTWANEYYQTVYATEPGSAEMPSAGRAFTPELITRLVAQGVQIAPLILHTGVASLEDHEPPYEEYYRVPEDTARLVNAAHAHSKRVIAVGTTVVRALETVTGADRRTHPGSGWTEVVITPERGLRAVDGLLTGFHEPRSSHLAMLQALAGREHIQHTYRAALEAGYLWHEFGDLHLILP